MTTNKTKLLTFAGKKLHQLFNKFSNRISKSIYGKFLAKNEINHV